MKRSGFKRPALPQRQREPDEFASYTPRPRPVAAVVRIDDGRARLTVPIPKRVYVRSPALLVACRGLDCQHCGAAGPDAGVCAAHSNWAVHGKGKGIKADDNRVAALCAACHVPLLDQGSTLSRASRQALWWAAHVRTVRELLARGLWPAGVRAPDIERCPFDLAGAACRVGATAPAIP